MQAQDELLHCTTKEATAQQKFLQLGKGHRANLGLPFLVKHLQCTALTHSLSICPLFKQSLNIQQKDGWPKPCTADTA